MKTAPLPETPLLLQGETEAGGSEEMSPGLLPRVVAELDGEPTHGAYKSILPL